MSEISDQNTTEKATPLSKKLSVDGNVQMEYNDQGTGIIVGKDFLISAESGKVVINKAHKDNGWKNVVIPEGKVGIGLESPSEKLHVKGNTKIEGNVEISVDSPSKKLHVKGNTRIEGGLSIDGNNQIDGKNLLLKTGEGIGFMHTNGYQEFVSVVGAYIGVLIGAKSNDPLHLMANNKVGLTVSKNGNIGIGTESATKAKLEVEGHAYDKYKLSKAYGIVKKSGAKEEPFVPTGNQGNFHYSIYASDSIACSALRAFSDQRIKNIKSISNSKNDLKILSKIEITDYQHIDVIGKGNGYYKKAIAQQVKTVFPQAVSDDIEDYIPNIYTKTKIEKGWIQLETDLKIDDYVKLHFSDEMLEVRVLEVKSNSFKVDTNKEDDVFVYGKQVNDFHTVDYDAISMLNVSATQELLKRIETLELELEKLKK